MTRVKIIIGKPTLDPQAEQGGNTGEKLILPGLWNLCEDFVQELHKNIAWLPGSIFVSASDFSEYISKLTAWSFRESEMPISLIFSDEFSCKGIPSTENSLQDLPNSKSESLCKRVPVTMSTYEAS